MTAAIEVENLRCEFRVHTGLMSAEKRVVAGDDQQPLTLLCGRDTLDASFDQLLR